MLTHFPHKYVRRSRKSAHCAECKLYIPVGRPLVRCPVAMDGQNTPSGSRLWDYVLHPHCTEVATEMKPPQWLLDLDAAAFDTEPEGGAG